jgi:hypothetical protein
MVRAEDVINLYQSLSDHHIQVWLTSGWGIDALLQEQKELWSENRVAAPRASTADKVSGNGYTDLYRLDSLGAIQADHLQVITSSG